METNVNYTIVGIFTMALITAIVLSVIWLSSGFSFEQYKIYELRMTESVSGLTIDSPVEYNGVNVGSVLSITLDEHDPKVVDVLLNINKTTPITFGTAATLTSRGLTGISFVSLKDKSEDLRPLVALPGNEYPMIKTSPSFFVRLDLALSQLSTNLKDVAKSVNALLSPDNQKSIREVLANMNLITENLAKNSGKLDTIILNTEKASRQFTPLLQSTLNSMRMFESQTMPATYRLMSNLDAMTHTMAEIGAEMKQNPSILVRGKAADPMGPGETK